MGFAKHLDRTRAPRPGASALLACALAGFAATGSPAAAQDAQALQLRALAATCANCHGTDGRAVAERRDAAAGGLPTPPTSPRRCGPSATASAPPR